MTNMEQMAELMNVNPINLKNWISCIRPYAMEYMESNDIVNPTPSEMNEIVKYASGRVHNLYRELLDNKTCRARVANKYLAFTCWHDNNENAEGTPEEDILTDEELIAEFGFDNVKRSLQSLKNRGL